MIVTLMCGVLELLGLGISGSQGPIRNIFKLLANVYYVLILFSL